MVPMREPIASGAVSLPPPVEPGRIPHQAIVPVQSTLDRGRFDKRPRSDYSGDDGRDRAQIWRCLSPERSDSDDDGSMDTREAMDASDSNDMLTGDLVARPRLVRRRRLDRCRHA